MQTLTEYDPANDAPYEERLEALSRLFPTHEVRVNSDKFGILATLSYHTKEDALEVARLLRDAAQETHEEGDVKGWSIDVYCLFSKHPFTEVPTLLPRWVWGARHGANRVADPEHKVFVSYWSRDCDHQWGGHLASYATLREAAEDCERQQDDAEGPFSWAIISQDEYEQASLE